MVERLDWLADNYLDRVVMHGSHVQARCPAHDDNEPSLSVDYQDGKVLLHCHAGCEVQDILAQLGLGWEALFDEPYPKQAEKLCEYRYQRPDGVTHMTVERWRTPNNKKTFRQRGSNGVDMRDTRPCLYNLPEVIPHCRAGGEVWIVEGEKDVHAARAHGLVATTAPMGAGKWQTYYWKWLDGASRAVVVADNDPEGRKGAARVCADLRAHGFDVQTVIPAEGCKDLFDHYAAGHDVHDFRPINLNRLRPSGVSHRDLMRALYPPITWCVPNLLPAGLAILGGTVKIGKSWLALDIGLGVARGLSCLGGFECRGGPVLYLSLDNDSEQRLQERVRHLNLVEDDPPIEFHVSWPTGPDAVAACQEWLTEATNPKLIVVDTLVRVEPDFDKGDKGGAYSNCTEVLTRWARLASDNDIAVLAVHHDRKGYTSNDTNSDWVDRFSGSRGLTASAATLMFLDAERGKGTGKLHVTGRDVATQDVGLYLAQNIWHATDLLEQTHHVPPPPVTGPIEIQLPGTAPLPDNVTSIFKPMP